MRFGCTSLRETADILAKGDRVGVVRPGGDHQLLLQTTTRLLANKLTNQNIPHIVIYSRSRFKFIDITPKH